MEETNIRTSKRLRSKLTFEEKIEFLQKSNVYKTRKEKKPENRPLKGVYEMTAAVRGRCVIIYNTFVTNKKFGRLLGYVRDAEYLEKVFSQLYFDVIVYDDEGADSAEEIKKIIRKEANSPGNEGSPNAFVLIILSHGDKNTIFGIDGKTVSEDEIVALVNNEKCPILIGKPKLIFIQACQGDVNDPGISNGCKTSSKKFLLVKGSVKPPQTQTACLPNGSEVSVLPELNGHNKEEDNIPTVSDLMICYSTVAGYTSFVKDDGSVFGISLAYALMKNCYNNDLQYLLNFVSADMKAESTRLSVDETGKQIPEVKYKGWTKQLWFNPGYPKKLETKKPPKLKKQNAISMPDTEPQEGTSDSIVTDKLSPSATPLDQQQQQRRKRGRPKKLHATLPDQQQNGDGRKRGRPKKSKETIPKKCGQSEIIDYQSPSVESTKTQIICSPESGVETVRRIIARFKKEDVEKFPVRKREDES